MKKTVLVTGGAGFIGANLTHELLQRYDVDVHIVNEPGSSLWRLTSVLDRLTIHEISLTNTVAIKSLVSSVKPQEIYHLAAYGGSPNQLDQQLIFDVNFTGTINLLNACKKVGFEVFINTGSSSEYGKRDCVMSESIALEPISDYAVAKAAATHFCLKEALFNNLPIYTIRPFSVYGNYEMPSRLIPTVLVNALIDTPLNLASPTNVRDYIYIKDMTSLYHTVALQRPGNAFVFNGGTGIQSSTADVISTTEYIIKRKLEINWGSAASRPWEPTSWRADISLAESVLNWKPQYNLKQGLQASLNWFASNLPLYTQTQGADHAPTASQQQSTSI